MVWFRKWLVACSGSSHYQNQSSHIVNRTPRKKLSWNLNQNAQISFKEMYMKMLSVKCELFCSDLFVKAIHNRACHPGCNCCRNSLTAWCLCAFFLILSQFYVPFYVKKRKLDHFICLLEFKCVKRLRGIVRLSLLLGLLFPYPVMWSSCCKSFEDGAPGDKIYRYQVFK